MHKSPFVTLAVDLLLSRASDIWVNLRSLSRPLASCWSLKDTAARRKGQPASASGIQLPGLVVPTSWLQRESGEEPLSQRNSPRIVLLSSVNQVGHEESQDCTGTPLKCLHSQHIVQSSFQPLRRQIRTAPYKMNKRRTPAPIHPEFWRNLKGVFCALWKQQGSTAPFSSIFMWCWVLIAWERNFKKSLFPDHAACVSFEEGHSFSYAWHSMHLCTQMLAFIILLKK